MKGTKIKTDLPLGGKIGRLTKIIVENSDIPTAEKVMVNYKDFETTKNNSKKAEWIADMLKRMKELFTHKLCEDIMESCGNKCCGINTRNKAKEIYESSNSLEEFISKLNESGIGGGRLKLKNANTIIGGYDRCYCGQVKHTKKPFPDLLYCQCSVGWYKQLFKSIFERDIKVELIQSIITGAKTCEFIIHI